MRGAGTADGGCRLSVSDTGLGMRPEMLDRIFEPFWQGNAHLARTREGMGLGLSIVRSFTELHDGGLHVDSSSGGGTNAHIDRPPERVSRRAA